MTTLVLVLLIASVVALTQARVNAGRAVFARLERAERAAVDEIAVRSRLRLVLADALTGNEGGVALDGTGFELAGESYRATVRLNDVGGMADLYFAPDALLEALPGGAGLVAGRAAVRDELAAGGRYPVEEATLARFGAEAEARHGLEGLVTQSGQPGPVNGATAVREVKAAAERLGMVASLPIRAVRVRVEMGR